MVDTITFATVDEHPLFLLGLVQSLQRTKGLVCIGEGETAADARRIAALQKPDILILGVLIPGGGIQAARAILSAHHHTKVLILTASDDEVSLKKALKAGVRAYVLKGISGSELVRIHQGRASRGAVHRSRAFDVDEPWNAAARQPTCRTVPT